MPLDEPTPEQIRDEQVFLEMGLNASEYKEVVRRLGRLPNLTEAGIFGVMWSEHCSYKNSKPLLGRYPTEGPRIMQGPGEGAGVVDLGEGWAARACSSTSFWGLCARSSPKCHGKRRAQRVP